MPVRDLYLVVADKPMEFALRGAFERPQALGTRNFSYEIDVHSGRDGGVRTTGSQLLSLKREQFTHAMLILDWEGSGSQAETPIELEGALDEQLNPVWGKDAKSIVIEPELDSWVWGNDNAMREVLRWEAASGVRAYLRRDGYIFDDSGKPERPKEAMAAATRFAKIPQSASLYRQITSKISLHRCTDPAFSRLRSTIRAWFPPCKGNRVR